MGKGVFAAACVALVLGAGCSGQGEGGQASSPLDAGGTDAVPDLNGTTSILVAPRTVTETMYFLDPPLLALDEGNRTVATPKGAALQPQTFTWNRTLSEPANITEASFEVWLRVTATQTQAGVADPGCTASAVVYFVIADVGSSYAAGCGSLGVGVVPPGDHRIRFSAPPGRFGDGVRLGPGDVVGVQVTLYLEGPSNLGPTCYILGGPDYESRVRFEGLNATRTD